MGRPTVHRIARRHDLDEEVSAGPTKPRISRGVAIAAVLSTIVVAIALGALWGSGSRNAPPPRPTTPTLSPGGQAAEVGGILKRVAVARHNALPWIGTARSPTAQAVAVAGVQRVYANGVRQLAALPAVTGQAPQTQAIDQTLRRLAQLYASLAAGARARSKTRYARAGAP